MEQHPKEHKTCLLQYLRWLPFWVVVSLWKAASAEQMACLISVFGTLIKYPERNIQSRNTERRYTTMNKVRCFLELCEIIWNKRTKLWHWLNSNLFESHFVWWSLFEKGKPTQSQQIQHGLNVDWMVFHSVCTHVQHFENRNQVSHYLRAVKETKEVSSTSEKRFFFFLFVYLFVFQFLLIFVALQFFEDMSFPFFHMLPNFSKDTKPSGYCLMTLFNAFTCRSCSIACGHRTE